MQESQSFKKAPSKVVQLSTSESKRPRRAAAAKHIDYDKDPYIYTGVG